MIRIVNGFIPVLRFAFPFEWIGTGMTINSEQNLTRRLDSINNLYLVEETSESMGSTYFPYFYAEVRIDFNDVRTGFRETIRLSKALEIYSSQGDLLWVADMIRDVNSQTTSPVIPETAHLSGLPEFVDDAFISRMETQFVQYLLRSFVTLIYRNSVLNIYSYSGESQPEFAARCMDLFGEPMRRDLDQLRDIFNRRLEQFKEKYMLPDESAGMEMARHESQIRDIFAYYSERIIGLFLRGDLQPDAVHATIGRYPGVQELEERLIGMEGEAQRAVVELRESYEEKSRALDEYFLHPNLKDIQIVRSGILWIPQKVG